jgi:hypothetical protein
MAAALESLRPEPHRGGTVAAGVVALTTAILLLEVRFDEAWGAGIHLVITGLALAAVAVMAVTAPMEGERPRAYQSALYVAAFVLALAFLANLADVLGANGGISSSSTAVWVGVVLGTFAAWLAVQRNSAIMTLLAAVTYGVVVLSFVDWVFDPKGVTTFRWILLLLIGGYALASLSQRGQRPRHGVQLVNAAGLAAIALALTFLFERLFGAIAGAFGGDVAGANGAGTGWELVLVACGFGLVAYGAVDREAGPAYLGVAVLLLFAWIAGVPGRDGASLIGWPVLLLIGAGALLVAGLRPSRPLPPPPDAGAPPPPPPTRLGDPPTTPMGNDDTTEIQNP